MKFEDQVTSLELSKKLKELGVKQDAFWSWYDSTDYDDTPRLNRSDENCPTCCLPQQTWEAKYSAFTVAELGEMLPAIVSKEGIKYFQHTIRNHKNEYALEYSYQGVFLCAFSWYKNEAEIRSKMLIHLIENKSLEH